MCWPMFLGSKTDGVWHRGVCLAMIACVAMLLPLAGCGGREEAVTPESTPQADVSTRADDQTQRSADPPSREASLSRIRKLISTGQREEADQAIQKHLLRFPDDPGAMVLAAGLLKQAGETDDAVEMLKQAARLSPDQTAMIERSIATILLEAGRTVDAIERLEGYLETHPDDDRSRHELVSILNQRGFRFDANEHVRQLCRRGQATPAELRGLMFPTRSFTGLDRKPTVDDSELIRRSGALNVARAMYSEGDVVEASQVLAASQLVKDKHPAAYAFYGQTLIESQQFDDFEAWYAGTPDQAKRYPAYWITIGSWASRQREFDAAIGCFAEAVLREPGDLATIDRMTQALAAGGYQEEQERFRRRGVLIDRVMNLSREVFSASQLDPAAVQEISGLLDDSGRPLAALAWYRIMIAQMGSPPQALRKIDEALALAETADFQAEQKSKRVCGLDLQRFPSDVKLAMKSADSSLGQAPMGDANYPKGVDPTFLNVASDVGLEFQFYNAETQRERELRLFEQYGAGVACFDYDLDGRVDLYLGQASCEPPDGRGTRPNLMARSLGDRFVDVTATSRTDDRGYACGVTAGDWNQDGFLDLVIANLSHNTLLINQGDGTFRSVSGDAVWNDPLNTTSLAMGDVNGDHLPDLIEVNYVDDPNVYRPIEYKPDGTPVQLPAPLDFRPSQDRVFLSVGDSSMSGRLIDQSGTVSPATGLGVILTDFDGEPGNEVFIANDHLANHFWEPEINVDSATLLFQDTAPVRGLAFGASGTPLGCMGIAVADFDENGRLDLHVTNFENEWNNQYMQDDRGFFDDLVVAYGLDQPTYKILGFGTQAIDYDHNIATDLVIGNGHVDDYTKLGRAHRMPTMIFTLDGSRFERKPVGGDTEYWDAGHLSRAVAICDWNRDGRMDVAVTDLIDPFALLENRTQTPYHWLQLKLVGTNAERDAIGATVRATFGGRTLTRVVQSGDGYMCKNEPILSFGLGEQATVDRLEIRWPDGTRQQFEDLPADRRLLIIQSAAEPFEDRLAAD